jgi:site-specific recombinase XerD
LSKKTIKHAQRTKGLGFKTSVLKPDPFFPSEDRKNSGDNVFRGLPVAGNEPALFTQFLAAHDLAPNSRRAFTQDMRKFAQRFTTANQESFCMKRVTVRDVTDFREYLRRKLGQAVATVNRCLVTVRKFFGWLVDQGHIPANPAKPVKELKRQLLAPKGLDRSQVRKLLREVELRQDTRLSAIFNMFLFTGCRVGDLVGLKLADLMMSERSGSVVFHYGKGNKQRSVPLHLIARRALQMWLESRPPVAFSNVFIGERGPLTDRGVRNLCDKYSAICGFKLHPHLLRHTMAHQFLADNQNDLVSLAQILGHENLNTTALYTKRTEGQLGEASDRLSY